MSPLLFNLNVTVAVEVVLLCSFTHEERGAHGRKCHTVRGKDTKPGLLIPNAGSVLLHQGGSCLPLGVFPQVLALLI